MMITIGYRESIAIVEIPYTDSDAHEILHVLIKYANMNLNKK